MKVLLRADAGVEQGTGHVMRCLTLAEELVQRGHEVHLMTGPISVGWLAEVVRVVDFEVHQCKLDELPLDRILRLRVDWLVVDSYRIPASEISSAAHRVPVLAIVDGTDRDIDATLYLDQNLGAELLKRRVGTVDRCLAGAQYALVRRAIVKARRDEPWHLNDGAPRVLCFMGGTDPTGSIVGVARSLSRIAERLDVTVVSPASYHATIARSWPSSGRLRLLEPTPELPVLLAQSEIVISAAGTSAWDICVLGIPAVLLAVVDNQRVSLQQAIAAGVALGLDAVESVPDALLRVASCVERLLGSTALREKLSRASRAVFDGEGASRVVRRLEIGDVGLPDNSSGPEAWRLKPSIDI